jgi:peroxiredoxin Q/BCP
MTELRLGDSIPLIDLKDQHGTVVDLTKGDSPKVIYFYPKDDTPGCTLEACGFRDQFSEFEDAGAIVYGISKDSVASHKKFATKHRLNFQLLSDPKGEAEKAFKVARNLFGLLPGRVTFIFDNTGKLIHKFNSAVMATKHVSEALNALKKSKK